MPRNKRGFTSTAKDAAALLGISVSQLNDRRRRDAWVYDPQEESLTRRLDPTCAHDAAAAPDLHLVSPTLAARKAAGGRWEYNLAELEAIQSRHWRGIG